MIGLCLLLFSALAIADETQNPVVLPSITDHYTGGSKSYLLALNEGNPDGRTSASAKTELQKEFEPPTFSANNAHKYLGLTTLALVAATALAPKPQSTEGTTPTAAQLAAQKNSTHAKLGQAAAMMAAATVTSGLLVHWKDFHLEDGWTDPDNLHVMFGTAGALAMLYAISQAPAEQHSTAGMAGGIAMAIAIKLTW